MLISTTTSVCPDCHKIINASILVDDDCHVRMEKTCDTHGLFDILIEKDYSFYKLVSNDHRTRFRNDFVLIPVTFRCNLNCLFCAEPRRATEDYSLDWLKMKISHIIESTKVVWIGLSGGEPTMRDDIFEIISYIKKNHPKVLVTLVTNGIKLNDIKYVRDLRFAGLDLVNFSMNGFTRDVYQLWNGNGNILDIKLKALDNLKTVGIKTVLAPILTKEFNCDVLIDTVHYAMNNLDFVEEIRIRNAAMVGNFVHIDKLMLSEMTDQLLIAIGKDRKFLTQKYRRNESHHSTLGVCMTLFIENGEIIDWNFGEYYKSKIVFNLRFLEIVLPIFLRKRKTKIFLREYVKILLSDLRDGKDLMHKLLERVDMRMLRIKIWTWFDDDNVDFNEITTGGGLYMTNSGGVIDLSEAIVSRDNRLL